MAVDESYVVLYAHIPLRPRRVVGEHGDVARQSVAEEALRIYVVDNEEVVVEVDEMFRQSGYTVHIAFYHYRVVCRQEFGGYEVLVAHEVNLRIVLVEPIGLLTARNEMYLSYPGRKFLHTAEPVLQEAVVSETCFRNAVLGVVLNKVERKNQKGYYNKYYGSQKYEDYYGHNEETKNA